MIQDLVIYAVYIGYALGVLLTFGTVLTGGRKQGRVMSDRIGANRAYIRVRSRRSVRRWVGPPASPTVSDAAEEGWRPKSYDWYAYVAPWVVFTPVLLLYSHPSAYAGPGLLQSLPAASAWFEGHHR
jgi:NADH-quinone oxidoreductase subunit H